MNNKDYLAKVQFKKKMFCKKFLISFVLLVLSFLIVMAIYDRNVILCASLFGLRPDFYALIMGLTFGIWKLLIIQFTLVPFLAMVFLEKELKR